MNNKDKFRDFNRDIWLSDISKLETDDRKFAEMVFKYLVGNTNSRPFHRKSVFKRQKTDNTHIFKTSSEDLYWAVLYTSKCQLVFHFHDKENRFLGKNNFLPVWCKNKQGVEGKMEKDIPLSGKLKYADEFWPLLEEIHANAVEWYGRIKDSTRMWESMFGDPKGGILPLVVPSIEQFEALCVVPPVCTKCGASTDLSLFYEKGTENWKILCSLHHPASSKWQNIASCVIPTEVRRHVWHRDKGRCVSCDSDVLIQYDHIIPRSKGGSNTELNIRLKCQSCNYSKGNKYIP